MLEERNKYSKLYNIKPSIKKRRHSQQIQTIGGKTELVLYWAYKIDSLAFDVKKCIKTNAQKP